VKPSPPMPPVPPAAPTDRPGLPAAAPEQDASHLSARSEPLQGVPRRRPPLQAVASPAPTAALRSELARLDSAYRRALRRALDASDAESISSRFGDADRLQRQLLAASRRLRAERGAEQADATLTALPGGRHSTTRGRQPGCDDAV
jgi:hypothetical protein